MNTADMEFPFNPFSFNSVYDQSATQILNYSLATELAKNSNIYIPTAILNERYWSVGAYFQMIPDSDLRQINCVTKLIDLVNLLLVMEGVVDIGYEELYKARSIVNTIVLIETLCRIKGYQPLRCNYSCFETTKPVLKDWSIQRIREFADKNDQQALQALFDVLCK